MGRPRDPATDAAILGAADSILFEQGYGALSIDTIAAAAGVARTTVYRRWPTVEHLVVALLASWQTEVPIPVDGDLRSRILALVIPVARALDPAPMRRVVAELAGAAARDADLRAEISALWGRRRAAVADTLLPVLADGSPATADVLLDLLFGPLYYRVLVTGGSLDDASVTAIVDTALVAIERRVGRS